MHDAGASACERVEGGRVVRVGVRHVDVVAVEPAADARKGLSLPRIVFALLREQRRGPQRRRVDAEVEDPHAREVRPVRRGERDLVAACREPTRDVRDDRLGTADLDLPLVDRRDEGRDLEDPQARKVPFCNGAAPPNAGGRGI